jgi:hypothetical protein
MMSRDGGTERFFLRLRQGLHAAEIEQYLTLIQNLTEETTQP